MTSSGKNKDKFLGIVGMRVLKTAIAVFVCFVISVLSNSSPFYSAIAAIISMKSDSKESINTGLNRIIGTLIGGAFGLLMILFINSLNIKLYGYIHYFLLSITLIPLIYTNTKLESPSSTTISCVVFLSITISHIEDVSPFYFALNRTVKTTIGVVVSLIVNRLL